MDQSLGPAGPADALGVRVGGMDEIRRPPVPEDEVVGEILADAPYVRVAPGYQSRPTVATKRDEDIFPWESQAAQYPATGTPGFSYQRHRLDVPGSGRDDIYVDCILYRDETGALAGILNHFPNGVPDLENPNAFAVFVHPDHRREGIGSALVGDGLLRGLGAGVSYRRGLNAASESGAAWSNANRERWERTGSLPQIEAVLRLRAKHGQPTESPFEWEVGG